MTQQQLEAFVTVGSMLKRARVERGFSENEVASRLKLVPEYVALLENDNFHALRSPAFARGYVRAYGRLVELDNEELLNLFDEAEPDLAGVPTKRVVTRQLQMQKTGLGVMVGLGVLLLLIVALWWWGGQTVALDAPSGGLEAAIIKPGESTVARESEG